MSIYFKIAIGYNMPNMLEDGMYTGRELQEIALNQADNRWLPAGFLQVVNNDEYGRIASNPDAYVSILNENPSILISHNADNIAAAFTAIFKSAVTESQVIGGAVSWALYANYASRNRWTEQRTFNFGTITTTQEAVVDPKLLDIERQEEYARFLQNGILSREDAVDTLSHVMSTMSAYWSNVGLRYLPDEKLHRMSHTLEAARWAIPSAVLWAITDDEYHLIFNRSRPTAISGSYSDLMVMQHHAQNCDSYACPLRIRESRARFEDD